MTNVVETLLIALAPGTLEGLLAVAIVLTYRSFGIVNVALGVTGALGATLAASLAPVISPAAAWIAAVLTTAVCAAVLAGLSQRFGPSRGYPGSLVLTAAAAVVVGYALDRTWDSGRVFPSLLPDQLIAVGQYQVTSLQVTGVVAGLLISVAAAAIARRSSSRASRLGHPVGGSLPISVVLLSGAVAGFCACCLGQMGFGPDFMLIPTLVAVLSALVARLRSVEVAFLAAVAVEAVRNLTIHFRLPHSGYTIAFLAVLLLAGCLYLLRSLFTRVFRVPGTVGQQRLDY